MVIQSVIELERIQKKMENEVSYVAPIFMDQHLHPAVNTLSSLHVLFTDGEYVCIPVNHPDGIPMTIDVTNAKQLVTLYKREILHAYPKVNPAIVDDVASMLQLSQDTIPEIREYYTPIIQRTLQQFQFKNLHLSIPLVVWMNYAHKLLQFVREKYTAVHPAGYDFVNNVVISTLTTIEKSGLHIDLPVFQEHFNESSRYVKHWMMHTEYNPYTATGRPSNKYVGVNFAALNKHDGSRGAFNSRFGADGILIQFDYEAFHPRLVANQIGYTLPTSSVHTYLAEQYYNTTSITSEQYETSKQRTFAVMYGVHEDVGNVEFFHKVRQYTTQLWDVYQKSGFVTSDSGKKIIVAAPSPNKVFNYMVQWMETETALSRVHTVCDLLRDSLTKPILYTYDALLLDVHRSEVALLPRIRHLLEKGGYPTRMYKGETYNQLISM